MLRRALNLSLLTLLVALLPACAPAADEPISGGVAKSLAQLGPPKAGGEPFRFAVLGDSQFISNAGFASIVEQTRSRRPALVFQVGDMILTDKVDDPAELHRQWARHQDHCRPLAAPFFPVPGNHDSATAAAMDVWRQVWGPRYYSFDYAGSHFIVLDSCRRVDKTGVLGQAQTEWLKRDLAATKAENIFLFFHHPFWLLQPQDWEPYHKLLTTAKVKAVFAGHTHVYNYQRIDGIDYVVTIAVLSASPHLPSGRFPHAIQVDVAAGSVTPAIFYQGKELPLDAVDPVVQRAHQAQFIKLTPTTAPDRPSAALMTLLNPTAGAVSLNYRWGGNQDGSWDVVPRSGSVELAPSQELLVPLTISPKTAAPTSFPRVHMDFMVTSRSGRQVKVERTQVMPLTAGLAGLGVAEQLGGRIVLFGAERSPAMAWLLAAMKIKPLLAVTPADLDRLWPTLRPGDTLLPAYAALDGDSPFVSWYADHRGAVRKFVEGGGRLIACLGHSDSSRPLLEDFGLAVQMHTRAWKTDRGGDNGLFKVDQASPLAKGLIGNEIEFTAVPIVSSWFQPKEPDRWTVLATDNIGGPAVLARTVGQGLVVLSAARLSGHHHMGQNYNQQRIWPNLLTLTAESLRRTN